MSLGSKLWGEYLQRHFRLGPGEKPDIQHLGPQAVAELLYPYMQSFVATASEMKAKPSLVSERQVDAVLKKIAISGELDAIGELPDAGIAELADRLEWAVSALMLEDPATSSFSLPVPRAAPDSIVMLAVLLSVLGGFGKERPRGWRQKSGF